MEWRLNLAVLVTLSIVWAHLTAAEPVSPLDPADPGTAELARMEDAFARDGGDVVLARRLAETYLELGRPGLAIATLRAGEPGILEHPVVAHRLAQAYEASGRVLDARATAELALMRCARSLGTGDAPSGTPIPRFACDPHQHAVLSMHRDALEHMVEWGVAVPASDARAQPAYDLAMRRVRIAARR